MVITLSRFQFHACFFFQRSMWLNKILKHGSRENRRFGVTHIFGFLLTEFRCTKKLGAQPSKKLGQHLGMLDFVEGFKRTHKHFINRSVPFQISHTFICISYRICSDIYLYMSDNINNWHHSLKIISKMFWQPTKKKVCRYLFPVIFSSNHKQDYGKTTINHPFCSKE